MNVIETETVALVIDTKQQNQKDWKLPETPLDC